MIFLNIILLGGAAAITIPIIVHLGVTVFILCILLFLHKMINSATFITRIVAKFDHQRQCQSRQHPGKWTWHFQ